ncbi:MAG: DUF2079 domain-containing protein [Candidatus Daviesbacteria bacterium]|nr:DUF2079 domain-containing protein [Candidatus Daviesbacteria bacterium]
MTFYKKLTQNTYLIPILVFICFALIFSLISLYHHLTFNTNAFDLGIYSQMIYLYSQDLSLYSSLKHMVLLADHFGPVLIILSPLVKLFPVPETLLITQAIFVSLSAIPLYLICLDKTKNILLSFLLILSYITSKGITAAINFDFHLATISVLPLSLILYFWYFKKWKLYWLTLIFSLLFKEDLPLFIAGLGLYQLIKDQKKLGLQTLTFAAISFYLIKFRLMALLWPGGADTYLSSSVLPLNDPMTLLILLFTRPFIFIDQIFNAPVKIATFINLNLPFALLPLLSPLFWLGVFPYLFLRFSSSYSQMWTMDFHHNANLLPFLVISAAFALTNFKIPHKPIIILLLVSLLFGGLNPRNIIWSVFQSDFANIKSYDYLNKSLDTIPPNAIVSAGSSIVPHLSNRRYIYMYPEVIDANYIVIDTSLTSYPLENEELQERIMNLEQSPTWQLERIKTLLIFKKK